MRKVVCEFDVPVWSTHTHMFGLLGGVGTKVGEGSVGVWGRFRTARAQRGHSANYYGDYPGNNPENHPPAESCTINSKLKNSNI